MERDPAVAQFANVITQTVNAALAGRRSPLASDVAAHAHAFSEGARWLDDLQAVVQAAAADVSALAQSEAEQATNSFQLAVAIFLFSLVFAAAAGVLLIRSVVRPLRRLSNTARQVAEGDFVWPSVAPSGPREVTETIAAVDELTAVLAAVESFTVTLAKDPTAKSLDVPLPGRTGLALQTTLDRLRESVREAERQRATLHEVAMHDGHTGLLNRTAALDAVTRELSRAQRDQSAVMLLFIDLDGLKSINDTHGHKAGDEAIKLAARALRDTARTSDVVARLGGDEFLVAGACVDDRYDLESLAERIHRAVGESTLQTDRGAVPLQCSIGVATSVPGDDVESLIHQADEALYAAKRRGRNQISWRHSAAVPAQRLPV
jgi:diguanylate cyclase (GGDEF)-like protein